ncbi:MAG: 4Fe-4S ferredoxin [Proteobacteria bacterium]|nr:4Fe-4S ferredoxin [Pseudomonadota bacterium]
MSLRKPSTLALFREARRLPRFSWFDKLHAYVYLRWPYFYISFAIGEHPLAQRLGWLSDWFERLMERPSFTSRRNGDTPRVSFADTYHGKVVPLEAAAKLLTVNRNIDVRNLERVVPYALAKDIVLTNPDHIVVMECPCRASRQSPCLPLDVCLIVGEPFAGFVLEPHPSRSHRITSHEAVEILRAEDERGHVHHAFFKDAMLGRFYAICNCCDCCCGAMQAHRHGTPMLASSGYTASVDPHVCAGCGECTPYCQFHALEVTDGLNLVDDRRCMGCGICLSKCAHNALRLERTPEKGQPLDIVALLEEAATSPVPH